MNARLPTILAQALAPFAPASSVVHDIVADDDCRAIRAAYQARETEPLPRESFNHDDYYEFNPDSLQLVRNHGDDRPDLAYLIERSPTRMAMLHNGNMVARGMRAQYLGLRKRAEQSPVPEFLRGAL